MRVLVLAARLGITASLLAAAAVGAGWKWEGLAH